jgi:hypothetical protein
MKIVALLLVLVFCLALTACSGPVKEVNDFANAKDEVILEMGKKIEANPTEAGVDEARKVFESKKEDLKAKSAVVRDKVKGSHGDLLTKLLDSSMSNDKAFNEIRKKVVGNNAADKKFTALQDDFKEAVKY